MKKIYLLFFALVALCTQVYSQVPSSSWWSVRGGVNFSNISSLDYSTDYYTGYNVGVTYAYPASNAIPIYIESGLFLQHRGARDRGFLTESGDESLLRLYELEIPLLLGFATPMGDDFSINPFVGLYYAVALSGDFKIGDSSFDPYRLEMLQTLRDMGPFEQQLLHRSDFGLRFGFAFYYSHYLLSLSYDAGMTNLYSRRLRDQGYEAQSGSFTLNLGCIF